MKDYRQLIAEIIAPCVEGLEASEIREMGEVPADSKMGDYADPCFKLAKLLRKAPPLIAKSIAEQIASDEIFEKVESGKCRPYPDEVLTMAEKYGRPSLCNFYCANECPIGREYVPEVKMKELSAIVLEMLASLNAVDKKRDRLIEITADGRIDGDEIGDFITIQQALERISIPVETLQLWAEKMLLSGQIDKEAYEKRLKEISSNRT